MYESVVSRGNNLGPEFDQTKRSKRLPGTGSPQDEANQLISEIAQLRARLGEILSEIVRPSAGAAHVRLEQTEAARQAEAGVRAVTRARQLREGFFDGTIFSDPAWDILLDLYKAELSQQRVSVSSLCIASGAPATTALRWMRQLNEMGLTRRLRDPFDQRRVFVELTEAGSSSMQSYFETIQPILAALL